MNPSHKGTTYYWRHRFRQNEAVADLPRTGRPRSVLADEVRAAIVFNCNSLRC